MKKATFFFVVFLLAFSACKKETETKVSEILVGRWQLVAMQNDSGIWQDTQPETYLLQIDPNGSISFVSIEGEIAGWVGCCTPDPYRVKGSTIHLRYAHASSCALVLCQARNPSEPLPSFSWRIVSVNEQFMEVEADGKRRRYKKLN